MEMTADGCLMCGKVFLTTNINKPPAAVSNTDKREINCGDGRIPRGEERGKMNATDTLRRRRRAMKRWSPLTRPTVRGEKVPFWIHSFLL